MSWEGHYYLKATVRNLEEWENYLGDLSEISGKPVEVSGDPGDSPVIPGQQRYRKGRVHQNHNQMQATIAAENGKEGITHHRACIEKIAGLKSTRTRHATHQKFART